MSRPGRPSHHTHRTRRVFLPTPHLPRGKRGRRGSGRSQSVSRLELDVDPGPASRASITASFRAASCSGRTVRGSRRRVSSSMRPMTGVGPVRRDLARESTVTPFGGRTCKAQVGRVSPGRLPPPMADVVSTTSTPFPIASRHCEGPQLDGLQRHRNHAPDGHLVQMLLLKVVEEGGGEGCHRHLVDPGGPGQGVTGQFGDQNLPSCDNARLRPSEQLVSRKGHQVHSGGDAVLGSRLI